MKRQGTVPQRLKSCNDKQMNKLIRNFLYVNLQQLLTIIIPLITTPYLTRHLGATSLGIDSYVLSIVTLCETFGSLGTNIYANREIAYVRNDKTRLTDVFWELFFLRLGLGGITSIVYLVSGFFSAYRIIFYIQSLHLIGYFVDTSWLFIGLERMKGVVLTNATVKTATTVLVFSQIHQSSDLVRYVTITATGQLVMALFILLQCRNVVSRIRFRHLRIFRHLKQIMALFLPQAASSIYVLFDKTMLGLLASEISCVSIYDKGEVLVKTPCVLALAVTTVLMPRMANEHAAGRTGEIKKLVCFALQYMFLFFIPLMVGFALVAPPFVVWYLGEAYTGSARVIQILSPIILAIALSNVSGAQYLIATNQTRTLTFSYLFAAILNLVGNYFLIPVWNELGAAFTTSLAEITVTLVQFYAMRKALGRLEIFSLVWKKFVAVCGMTAIIIFIQQFQTTVILWIGQILVGAATYFLILFLLRDEGMQTGIKMIRGTKKTKKSD